MAITLIIEITPDAPSLIGRLIRWCGSDFRSPSQASSYSALRRSHHSRQRSQARRNALGPLPGSDRSDVRDTPYDTETTKKGKA